MLKEEDESPCIEPTEIKPSSNVAEEELLEKMQNFAKDLLPLFKDVQQKLGEVMVEMEKENNNSEEN